MTKKEKIQDAYGVHWEFYKDKVDENGWVDCRKIGHGNLIPIMEVKDIQFQKHKQRPKSLQGIAENNGWIKIDNQTDIKHENCDCFFIVNNEIINGEIVNFDFYYGDRYCDIEKVSHYHPIIKPDKPLY